MKEASSLFAVVWGAFVLVGCGADAAPAIGQGGGGGTGGAGVGGGAGSGPLDPAALVYPDVAALHAEGISRTCSLNAGVCHQARQYPELSAATNLLGLVNAPCQFAPASPSLVPDECERPGDKLVLGSVDHEILDVTIGPNEPFPPQNVTLRLAGALGSLDTAGARVRRLDDAGNEVLSVPLGTVTLTQGAGANLFSMNLAAAIPMVRGFFDARVTTAERVRVGDPNGNGLAHPSAAPWSLVTPGDPGRSYLYKRLLVDTYGPTMPLIERTWSALATRAVYCWIRGMSPDAQGGALSIDDPIDYDNCPLDPDAPDPNQAGTWSSVRTLLGSRCATAGCHAATTKAGGLDLTPDAATFSANVLSAPSSQQMGALRVVPGQPAASYLFCKMDPACDSIAPMTKLMPLSGEPLTQKELESVSKWIFDGAKLE